MICGNHQLENQHFSSTSETISVYLGYVLTGLVPVCAIALISRVTYLHCKKADLKSEDLQKKWSGLYFDLKID